MNGLSSLSGVAGGNDLTAHLPTGIGTGGFSVRRLSMAFDAATYAPSTLDLEVGSDGPWGFPGLTGFDVRDLSLALHIGWPGPSVTGHIGGTIELDGFALRIGAGRTAAADPWSFTGSMVLPPGQTSLALGPFIKAIAARLGGLDVPAALAGATLSQADVTFDTAGGMSFDCKGSLPVDGELLELQLDVKVERAATGFRATFGGSVTVDKQSFTLNVSEDPSVTRLIAAYTHDKTTPPVDVGALLTEVWPGAPATGLKVDVHDVVFALATDAAGTRVVFALDLEHIDLSGLPLVGAVLADAAKVDDLQVVAATAAPVGPAGADRGDVAAWNLLLPANAKPLPATGLDRGVAISAQMTLAGSAAPLSLPAAAPPPVPAGGGGVAAPPADGTKWFPVQRSFGPVYFGRVGARYETGMIWLALDASLSLGGLSVSLMGLSVGSPLSAFEPAFHLDGLGLDFSAGGVEIAGAFLAVPEKQLAPGVSFQYDGAAIVRAASFTLSAVGSYAEVEKHPSLFLFAELNAPLGGPPAFYVTGLMGGFGYNRALRIPGQDEVHSFPFVAGLETPVGDGTPLGVLGVLEGGDHPWLTEGIGQNWIAVGVTFTSFELVESRALLIAEFGRELLFALIGLAKLRLPKEGTEAFAYVELELEAILRPQEGFFGLTAVLSPNSFVIAPECRLTGGFAFYVWFAGDHAGDFVLTLGGYHPAFDRPDWYPQEPRLALTWAVDDLVTVEGDAYFALTPSCVMGGGGLRLLFHDGNLRAWLTASADFLISWRPFRYQVHVGVSIGVSYRLVLGALQKTLSVEIGAQVTLWGPPTGGTAHISWYFISFDIAFGAGPPKKDEVIDSWSYVAPLLPSEDLCKVSCQSGLLAHGASADAPWVVRADGLQLASECVIPATTLQVAHGTTPDFTKPEQAPAIRPLGRAALDATHTLHVKDADGKEIDLHGDGWKIEARTRSMPAALWGAPLAGDPPAPTPSADLVGDQWIGLVVSPPAATASEASVTLDMNAAMAPNDVTPGGTLPAGAADAPAPGAPADGAMKAIAGIDAAAPARAAIRAALGDLDPGTDDPLGPYAAAAAAGLFPPRRCLRGRPRDRPHADRPPEARDRGRGLHDRGRACGRGGEGGAGAVGEPDVHRPGPPLHARPDRRPRGVPARGYRRTLRRHTAARRAGHAHAAVGARTRRSISRHRPLAGAPGPGRRRARHRHGDDGGGAPDARRRRAHPSSQDRLGRREQAHLPDARASAHALPGRGPAARRAVPARSHARRRHERSGGRRRLRPVRARGRQPVPCRGGGRRAERRAPRLARRPRRAPRRDRREARRAGPGTAGVAPELGIHRHAGYQRRR